MRDFEFYLEKKDEKEVVSKVLKENMNSLNEFLRSDFKKLMNAAERIIEEEESK